MADPSDPLYQQFSREFQALADDTTPVLLQLQRLDAWIILSQLQLALRHPQNTGESAQAARRIARQLEALVAADGALAEVCRRGWEGE